ncbi:MULTISPECIES: helix-turn-helix transcriptional regulator [Paenibacillus]|nr:helix-turn-helix transcriptional regulator [Paenibacillus borealis]
MGQRIRTYREKKEWTQDVLGEKVRLTRSSIANIELGKQKVPLSTIYLIAHTLQVEIFDILPSMKEITTDDINLIDHLVNTDEFTDEQLSWVSGIIKKGLNEG